ncbi:MAG: hypothetical protein ACJ786_03060 [Catenulispora sp.]
MAEPNDHRDTDGESVLRRERGLRRVSTTTRWTVAAAAAGTAALGLTYTHLLPGASAATSARSSAPSGRPAAGTACVQPAPALVPAPAPISRGDGDEEGDRHDDGDSADDAGDRIAGAVQPAAAVCPGGAANGLTPPAQPPTAAVRQAPQTRTGAS